MAQLAHAVTVFVWEWLKRKSGKYRSFHRQRSREAPKNVKKKKEKKLQLHFHSLILKWAQVNNFKNNKSFSIHRTFNHFLLCWISQQRERGARRWSESSHESRRVCIEKKSFKVLFNECLSTVVVVDVIWMKTATLPRTIQSEMVGLSRISARWEIFIIVWLACLPPSPPRSQPPSSLCKPFFPRLFVLLSQ